MGIIIGDKFSRLTVFNEIEPVKIVGKNWQRKYLCKCECGNVIVVQGSALTRTDSHRSKSCGCWKKDHPSNKTHGMSHTAEYQLWGGMVRRCTNPKCKEYKSYGGRGISVCARWLRFENFFSDMGKRPEGMSLNRIDNYGNYCKENCEWTSYSQQASNTRRNKNLTYNGKTQNIVKWAKELGLNPCTLYYRKELGWSDEKILTRKVFNRGKRTYTRDGSELPNSQSSLVASQ
jgi:hypothetical protein